jgi:hypothetical protein
MMAVASSDYCGTGMLQPRFVAAARVVDQLVGIGSSHRHDFQPLFKSNLCPTNRYSVHVKCWAKLNLLDWNSQHPSQVWRALNVVLGIQCSFNRRVLGVMEVTTILYRFVRTGHRMWVFEGAQAWETAWIVNDCAMDIQAITFESTVSIMV